jgi:hypothetical protein
VLSPVSNLLSHRLSIVSVKTALSDSYIDDCFESPPVSPPGSGSFSGGRSGSLHSPNSPGSKGQGLGVEGMGRSLERWASGLPEIPEEEPQEHFNRQGRRYVRGYLAYVKLLVSKHKPFPHTTGLNIAHFVMFCKC